MLRAHLLVVAALGGCSFDVTRHPAVTDSRADLRSDTRLDAPFRADAHPDLPLHLDLSIRDTRPDLGAKPFDAKKEEAKPLDAKKLPEAKPPDAMVQLVDWYQGSAKCPSNSVSIAGGVDCSGAGALYKSYPDLAANQWFTGCTGSVGAGQTYGCATAAFPAMYAVSGVETASCAGGELVSGGCRCTAANDTIAVSHPLGNAWYCGCADGGTPQAHAICVSSPPAGFTVTMPGGGLGAASSAPCPGTHQLVGGGCKVSGSGKVLRSAPLATFTGWSCAFDGIGNAYALCAQR